MVPSSSVAPADIASAFERVRARAPAIPLDAQWYASLPSTMDVAAEAATSDAREGVVIVADEQTAGRGRRGRSWSSPPGAGLYLSFVFRPPLDATSERVLSLLMLGVGVGVRTAIERACGFGPELKWPNDIMVGRRKLAGVLAEGSAIGSTVQTVVVGVGLNVLRAAHPGEAGQRATSLEDELGRPVERGPLLEEILLAVPDVYHRLRHGEANGILRQWRAAAPSACGAIVEWNAHSGPCRGTTVGIGDDGALLVETSGGVERVISGELRWL